jgi:tetratricopeptide (TPR) repeat protein
LVLDSTLAAPYVALASVEKGLGEWSAAEASFSRALARQPDLASVHQNLGEMYYTLGRVNEAQASLGQAAALEPTNSAIVGEYAFALLMAGQTDSANTVINRALAGDSGIAFLHFTRGLILERRGDAAAALAAHRRAYARTPLPLFLGAQLRTARLANDGAAERAARAQLAASDDDPGSALARAIADAGVVPVEQSIAELARAVSVNDPIVSLLPLRLWWFDALRDSPAFAQAVQSLRLPPEALSPLEGRRDAR